MISKFADIGYKFMQMPDKLDTNDYIRILSEMNVAWCEKEFDEWSILDIKEFQNSMARLEIMLYLNKVSKTNWSDYHRRLFENAISDLDFYESERQFNKIFE